MLCRQFSRLGCINHRSSFQHSPTLSPALDFPSSGRKWGVSWSSLRPTAATFLLGPAGFPYWVPAVRQKPRGLPLPVPCLLNPALALPTKVAWDQLPGKYQHQPGINLRGWWRRRRRKSVWHLPTSGWLPLLCPPVVAAHSLTCHAPGAPCVCGGSYTSLGSW